jgi:ribosomal protein S27AE
MDIGSIFLILGLLVLVGLYIIRPFIVRSARGVSAEEKKLSAVLAEQERLINTLKELDFDYSLGKVPEADYPAQRATLVAQAAEAMRQVDMLTATGGVDVSDRIETAIAARRAEVESPTVRKSKRTVAAGAAPDDELEALIASRRRERIEKAAGFCPQCGKPVQISDKFCPRCGASLLLEEGQKA